MNAFHYFLIVARVDLEGLFWQIICYGKNEITKPFSTSCKRHFFLLYNGDVLTVSLGIYSFTETVVSHILLLAISALPSDRTMEVTLDISEFMPYPCLHAH